MISQLPTQPLRDEHQDLLPHVEQLRYLGDAASEHAPDVREALDTALEFLEDHLLIHAYAEEQVLYPVVGEIMGAPEATATMSRDHSEVETLISELARVRDTAAGHDPSVEDLVNIRRTAYGLYALLKVHFAKEEEVYLPLLDARLPAARATAMFEEMEHTAAGRRSA